MLTALAVSVFFVVPYLFPNGRVVPRWTAIGLVLATGGGLSFIFALNPRPVP